MATYNLTDGSVIDKPPMHTPIEDRLFIRRAIVDMTKQNLDAGDGDVAQVIIIPAKTYILSVWTRIITAETTNGTCDIGSAAGDTYADALALDATAGTIAGADLDWVPLYHATADTIDVTATTDTADVDLTIGKFELVAVMLKALDNN